MTIVKKKKGDNIMFKKKQLYVNIDELDLQIGKLSRELNEMKKEDKYESTMDKLKSLTELRGVLKKSLNDNQESDALVQMDKQIEELTMVLEHTGRDEEYSNKLAKLEELTKVRCQLAESGVNGSVKPIVVSSLLSIASLALVLKYEETEVITSKAFNMATSMFRGSK